MTVEADVEPSEVIAAPRRARRSEQVRREQRSRRFILGGYLAALAVLAGAIVWLGYQGVRTILASSDGEVVDPVLDPTEPGYRALVPPSPTLLVLQTDEAGGLVGAVLLALASEDGGGGSVLIIPPATVAELPDVGPLPIEATFTFSGAAAARAHVEWAIGIAIDELVVLGPTDWADLLAQTAPLTITNPDSLRDPAGTVVFPGGPLSLGPAEVPAYAAFLAPDESQLNQTLRQELVWNAWMDQVAVNDVDFPGEQDLGLARFVPAIASGGHRVETLPVTVVVDPELPGEPGEVAPDDEAVAALIVEVVPFPAGNAGRGRPLVRVLSGTGDVDAILPAARRAVMAGGQIVAIGNADEFDQEATEVIYWDDARRDDARAVVEALGFGTVTKVVEVDESADIVVVLGTDAGR